MIAAPLLLLAAVQLKALDPCSLLEKKAIVKAQGAAPKTTKASEHPEAAFLSQQCFYALPDFSKSVSLEVTRPRPGAGKGALKERWEQISGEEKDRRKEEEERDKASSTRKPSARGSGEEEEEHKPPRVVHGVGRGAVWTGSQRAGVLYVLGKAAIVRVSVGGPASEDEKIKACSALAKGALERLGR